MADGQRIVSQTSRAAPAVLFDRSAAQGRLLLTERDRLDLLHRMSTNDLRRLEPGQGCATVLTTALARIIDRVIVLNRGESALMLTGQPQIVRSWLQRHIFWQDQVKIRDVSAEFGNWELHGPQAAALAERIAPGAAGLALHHFIERDGPDEPDKVIVARTFALHSDGGPGFALLAPPERLTRLLNDLLYDPPDELRELVSMGDEALYELWRVEAGLPAVGHELTEEYIPLEAGLWDAVSFSKGCYIGQEIIARMESRNKLARMLVKVRLEGQAAEGAALRAGGAAVGSLTSVVRREGEAHCTGLGFVKPEFAAPGTVLSAQGVEGEIAAVVQAAPGAR